MDGARRPGAKILVSGGGRCNVTNARVTERDFHGGSPASIRQVLRNFPVEQTIAFFDELGVPLHEEDDGKLFPDSHRSRDVLEALLREAEARGVERRDACRVTTISRAESGFRVGTAASPIHARRVVLATGGQSLPKSGSDGAGFALAASLGHHIVPPVPALVPLVLGPDSPIPHQTLAGVSHPAELSLRLDGRVSARVQGSVLWTHFGISGPATLDLSRHWTRAAADRRTAQVAINFRPGLSFDAVEAWLLAAAADRPRASVGTVLSDIVPASVGAAIATAAAIDAAQPLASFSRSDRRRLTHALTELPLPVNGTRGYNYAEVTAGGVVLTGVDPRTMESRVCRGLFLVGEILDVDGRLGGFNFQWAWASARTAALGLTAVRHARGRA